MRKAPRTMPPITRTRFIGMPPCPRPLARSDRRRRPGGPCARADSCARAAESLERNEIGEVLVDELDVFLSAEDILDHFVVQALTCDLWSLNILGIDRIETSNVALGLVDALRGITLGDLSDLVCLALGFGDLGVVGFLALVHQSVHVLDSLVDVLEGILHSLGGTIF